MYYSIYWWRNKLTQIKHNLCKQIIESTIWIFGQNDETVYGTHCNLIITHCSQVFLLLPRPLVPSTTNPRQADTQSSTLLRSRCPNHLNLPRLTTSATQLIPRRLHKSSLRLLSFWNAATMAVVFICDIFFSIVFVYSNWLSIETNNQISFNSSKLSQIQYSNWFSLRDSNNSINFSANSFASNVFFGFGGVNPPLSPGHVLLKTHHFAFNFQYNPIFHSFTTSFTAIEPFFSTFPHFTRYYLDQNMATHASHRTAFSLPSPNSVESRHPTAPSHRRGRNESRSVVGQPRFRCPEYQVSGKQGLTTP